MLGAVVLLLVRLLCCIHMHFEYVQADTLLRSVLSCPCLLSPLRGSHTASALARLCRMPRPAVRVDDRPRPCVHSYKPRQRYRRTELFCNIRFSEIQLHQAALHCAEQSGLNIALHC